LLTHSVSSQALYVCLCADTGSVNWRKWSTTFVRRKREYKWWTVTSRIIFNHSL